MGNGPAIPLRPSIPLNTRTFGTKGLAKTKENFPALGGGKTNVAPPSTQSVAPSTSAATALFKQPQKAAAKAAKSVQQQPAVTKTKLTNSTVDFPSLPGTSGKPLVMTKTKSAAPILATTVKVKAPEKVTKSKSAVPLNRSMSDFPSLSADAADDSDFIETTHSFSMAAVSAKHRGFVPMYESVAAGNSSKINTIQRVESAKTPINAKESVPKLNSNASFPALGGGSATTAAAPQWLGGAQAKSKKQPQTSKKLKVAPAPLLNQSGNATNQGNKAKTEEKPKAKIDLKKEETPAEGKKSAKKDKKAADKLENTTNSTKTKAKDKSNESKENQKKNGDNTKNNNHPLALQNGYADGDATTPSASTSNGNGAASLAPPPGFNSSAADAVKPPPGFAAAFHLSNGTTNAAEYVPPLNASQRNQILVSFFQKALKTPEAVEAFRNSSKLFRGDLCSAETFYEHCEATLGPQFHSIFPELLVLLPDIRKQQVPLIVYFMLNLNDNIQVKCSFIIMSMFFFT